jgi:hypothetical protein
VHSQYPIDEMKALRGPAATSGHAIMVKANTPRVLLEGNGSASGVVKQSEVVASFTIPSTAATFGIIIGAKSPPTPSGTPVGNTRCVLAAAICPLLTACCSSPAAYCLLVMPASHDDAHHTMMACCSSHGDGLLLTTR